MLLLLSSPLLLLAFVRFDDDDDDDDGADGRLFRFRLRVKKKMLQRRTD